MTRPVTLCCITVTVVVIFGHSDATEIDAKHVTTILHRILDNYDRKIRPGFAGRIIFAHSLSNIAERAVNVKINIDVLSLGDIDEKAAQFSLHCYFRQAWKDDRLSFPMFE